MDVELTFTEDALEEIAELKHYSEKQVLVVCVLSLKR